MTDTILRERSTVVPSPPEDVRDTARDTSDIVVPTGRFRVYLGAAAGVGKTCAMLDEGWRRHERGADVVIGFVETHGRPNTDSMVRDLEVVPRKMVPYRDSTFPEMDVDAVLARQPEVVLVDEMAHTNVPGSSTHEKRWEDIFTLLDAGIAVISTLNIQHIESLADAVERFSGSPVRERVPDWVVQRADQIELIDSSPEQLRRRMLHGNIYAKEKVPGALNGFFQTRNLTALRELALRYLADDADEELLSSLASAGTDHVWDTAERVMVVATGSEKDEAVIHRAARIAARLKCSLDVVLVRDSDSSRLAQTRESLLAIATKVGASTTELASDDVVTSVMDLAIRTQVTQLVVAAPGRARLRRTSALARLLPAASEAGIDVHLIAGRSAEE
jgi:two-component system, OmpR family, sensor histidine kinase KdpD